MRAILDALSLSVVLVVLPWLIIQMGVGAVLAWRNGMNPAVGAAFGLIPIPCIGWVCVAVMAKRGYSVTDDDLKPIKERTIDQRNEDDDGW